MVLKLDLYNDTVNRKLVTGLNDSGTFDASPFYQFSKLQVRVFPVIPIKNAVTAPFFEQQSTTSMTMKMALGIRSPSKKLYAYNETWTNQSTPDSDGLSNYFYGTLDLQTSEMNTALTGVSMLQCDFEIVLSDSGISRVTYQSPVYVSTSLCDVALAAPIEDPAYLTDTQIAALYIQKSGDYVPVKCVDDGQLYGVQIKTINGVKVLIIGDSPVA